MIWSKQEIILSIVEDITRLGSLGSLISGNT
jgi:hypothetical protein